MKRFLVVFMAFWMLGCASQETFTLWQLESQVDTIGNSYVIRTAGGKLIVMDGGMAVEKDYLRGFIDALGGRKAMIMNKSVMGKSGQIRLITF